MQTAQKNEKDRRLVHCLVCHKPQDTLSTHLARVCMKTSSSEERLAEVQRAKDSMKAWSRQGRNWEYAALCKIVPDRASRVALVQHLQERDFFVAGATREEDIQIMKPLTSDSEDSSTDPTESSLPINREVRCNMQKMGLYEVFPSHTPILLEFKEYLVKQRGSPVCRQEVDNVSRMLRYMQPTGDDVSMDFLRKSTKTRRYIVTLQRARLLPPTILNYIKSMIRFVWFLTRRENVDQHLRMSCERYVKLLNTLRKTMVHRKAPCKTSRGHKTLSECQRLLRDAKREMLHMFKNLKEGKYVSSDEKTLLRYYCEAVLILGHFQKPGAVEDMTVSDWLNKDQASGRVCVGSSQQKNMQSATFTLTTEESAMLDAYYRYVRPACVQDEADDDGKFFISQRGRPITSATNDIARLHVHYKLPSITSQEIRWAVENAASTAFIQDQESQVAHDGEANALSSLTDYRAVTEGKGQKRARDLSDDDSGGKKDFGQFLEAFPVTLTGQPPTKREQAEAGFDEGRRFYDKWRTVQFGKREECLLSKIDHPPNVAMVTEMIDREGWTANHPHPEDVVAKWSPPKSIETDENIMRRMLEQKWSGVAVKDYGDDGEQGVVATKSFTKGSVICDYPGELITAEEGLRILESAADEMGYLFFFSSDSRRLCINVWIQPGPCCSSLETVGIKMNHTRKNPNVKLLPIRMKFSEGEKDSLLLVAARDIAVDEELLLGIET